MRRHRQATSSHPENRAFRMPAAAGEPHGTVASFSARHGWLRRNAVSPHGVRLSDAPGALLRVDCSSANRALTGNLPRDGIVAVPGVFDARHLVLFPDEERGQAGERDAIWGHGRVMQPSRRCPTYLPSLRAHGDARRTQGVAATAGIWRLTRAARINSGPEGPRYRVNGPSGFTQAAEKSWKDH
jgi:hypothetical protein